MKFRSFTLVTLALGFIATAKLDGAILYHQTFRHPESVPTEGNNVPMSSTTLGWTAYYGSTAKNITTNTAGSSHSALIGWVNGAPSGEGPGYLYSRDSNTNASDRTYMLVSEPFEYPFRMSQGLLTAQFYGNISVEGIGVHFMIKVANQWYVSQDLNLVVGTQSSMSQSTALAAMKRSLDLVSDASAWQLLSLNPGTSYSLGGTPTSDVFGDITQFGFFITNPTGVSGTLSARLDSLQISQIAHQVPEPRTCLLLFLAGSALMWRRQMPKSEL